MEKTTQRFQKIAATLADLNAEGLMSKLVNDLLSMFVGAASQHALRVSLHLSRRHKTLTDKFFLSGRVLCIATLPRSSFFYPSSLEVWCGFCCSKTCCSSMACVQSVIPSLMTSPDTNSLFRSTPILRDQLTLSSQTTRSCSSPPNHRKETSLPKEHPQTTLQQPH